MTDKRADELAARVKELEEALADIRAAIWEPTITLPQLRGRIVLALLKAKPAERDGGKG